MADGTGQGTAFFKGPGGAVPPGLRKPSDLAVSVIYQPGGGTAPPNRGLVLLGIGVEVAVVEGGYALLTKETQVVDTLSSVVTIQSDSVADGSRTLVLFVKPAPGTLSAQIEMDSARAIHVDTVPIQSDEPFTLLTLSGDWSNGYQVRLNCATGRPFHLSITDRRPGLPEAAGFKGYPEDVIPGTGRRNHTTAVKKSFAF